MTYWQRWIWQPQTTRLRKTIFQVHLWSGIGLGLYVLMASVTGSILVFSNELYRAATRDPIVVTESGGRLSDDQLKGAATRAYPGYTVLIVSRERNPDQAVAISLKSGRHFKSRLFNPYTGADLGDSVPPGIRVVSKLTELHDDLLAGPTGRKVNGAGAAAYRARIDRNGRLVAGDQDMAARPDGSQERRVATFYPGSAQHDRVLEPGIHPVVWGKRGLSRQPAAVSGPGRPDRALHRRQRRGTHGRPDYLLAGIFAFRAR